MTRLYVSHFSGLTYSGLSQLTKHTPTRPDGYIKLPATRFVFTPRIYITVLSMTLYFGKGRRQKERELDSTTKINYKVKNKGVCTPINVSLTSLWVTPETGD